MFAFNFACDKDEQWSSAPLTKKEHQVSVEEERPAKKQKRDPQEDLSSGGGSSNATVMAMNAALEVDASQFWQEKLRDTLEEGEDFEQVQITCKKPISVVSGGESSSQGGETGSSAGFHVIEWYLNKVMYQNIELDHSPDEKSASPSEDTKQEVTGQSLSGTLSIKEIEADTDIKPGLYEGGLKVWECALDLIRHFLGEDKSFEGLRVMELGCGHGLPGIHTLIKGAAFVDFFDYNKEVLECATIANVAMNNPPHKETGDSPLLKQCRFFAGDWEDLLANNPAKKAPPANLLGSGDVILMSDTLYTEELSIKALKAIVRLLKKPNASEKGGEAFVAAKRYYFGCGGSVAFFEGLVVKYNELGMAAFESTSDNGKDEVEIGPPDFKLDLQKICVGTAVAVFGCGCTVYIYIYIYTYIYIYIYYVCIYVYICVL
jgi:predicted nicotinamide N-methyase